MKQQQALTPQQVQALYTFCASHYVHHYDLQTELVDHLATGIEESMARDPQLSFEAALAQMYQSFGISGFSKLVQERTRQLERSNFRLRWRLFLQYFRWPRLALSLLLATLVYCLGNWLPAALVGYLGMVAFLGMALLDMVYLRRINRLKRQLHKQLLLTQDVSSSGLWLFFCFQLYSSKLLWANHQALSQAQLYALMVFVVLLSVAIVSNFEYCRALYTKAREQYPGAFEPAGATA